MPQRIGDRVLLSTTEAAQISQMSRAHIVRLLRAEQLEGMKLGHDWLVLEDSLKAYLAQPRKPGPKPTKPETSEGQTTPAGASPASPHVVDDSYEYEVQES